MLNNAVATGRRMNGAEMLAERLIRQFKSVARCRGENPFCFLRYGTTEVVPCYKASVPITYIESRSRLSNVIHHIERRSRHRTSFITPKVSLLERDRDAPPDFRCESSC